VSLNKNISISSPKNSTVVVLSALASSPEQAQQIVQALLSLAPMAELETFSTSASEPDTANDEHPATEWKLFSSFSK
jgi:capsular polysaccharide biosynthesis protein